ncbi:MAG: hypothetical protein IJY23_07710 [Clostridia bacterium]|nr:hypothetical protein [Clostridia bacterium]
MKRTNLKKALAFVFAFALLLCAVMAVSVSAADETEPTVEIVSNNVYYGDTMRLMYAVHTENADGYELSVDIYDAEDNWLCEAVSGSTIEEIGGTDTVNELECSIFVMPTGVPAQNISAEFYAVAKLSNGTDEIKSAKHKYSVLEYLYERLLVTENVEDEKKTLYRSLLEYADVADRILNKTTEANAVGSYHYVKVNNGTMNDSVNAGVYKAGTVIESLSTDFTVSEGKVLAWEIVEYDNEKNVKSTLVVRDSEFAGYTVGEYSVIITPTEADAEKTVARLVTDISQIGDGKKIIIVAKDYNEAMSTEQKSSNRGVCSITKDGDTITVDSDSIQIITLVAQTDGSYLLQIDEGKYLNASGGTSNNQLKTTTDSTLSTVCFNILVDSTGTATIDGISEMDNDKLVRDVIKYYKTTSNSLFNCYASTYTTSVHAISIYVIEE